MDMDPLDAQFFEAHRLGRESLSGFEADLSITDKAGRTFYARLLTFSERVAYGFDRAEGDYVVALATEARPIEGKFRQPMPAIFWQPAAVMAIKPRTVSCYPHPNFPEEK